MSQQRGSPAINPLPAVWQVGAGMAGSSQIPVTSPSPAVHWIPGDAQPDARVRF